MRLLALLPLLLLVVLAVLLLCKASAAAGSHLHHAAMPPDAPVPPPPPAGTARYPARGSGYCTASSFALSYGGASGWLNAGCASQQFPAICEVIPAGPRGRVVSYRWGQRHAAGC